MRVLMRLELSLLTVFVGACGPTTASRFEIVRPPVIASCRPVFSVGASPPPELLQDPRTPLRVLLGVMARFDCADLMPRGFERLDVQVVNDRGAPAGRVLTRSDGPGGSRLELELEPMGRPGTIDVIVQAEPTLGRQVLTYEFVPMRSPTWEALGPWPCSWLIDLPDARWGCASPGSSPLLVLSADGGLERTLPSSFSAQLAGRDLWLLQATSQLTALRVHFAADGGVEMEPIDAGILATTIASLGQRVVLGGHTRERTLVLQEYGPSGVTRLLPTTADGGEFEVGLSGIQFLNEDELLVVRTATAVERWPAPSRSDGGLLLGPIVLGRGAFSTTRDGIWLVDDLVGGGLSRVTLLRPDAGIASVTSSASFVFRGSDRLVPVGVANMLRLIVVPIEGDAGTLSVDRVRLPLNWQLGGVTSEWIYARDDRGVLVRTPRQ